MSSLAGNIVSDLFTTGDVSFRSSDGVLFRVDQWRLEFVSDVFPPIRCLPNEVVPLNEDSQTLGILFTFLYPARPIPDIGALSFNDLVKLLNATDKYAFNSAIEISLFHFQKYAQAYPLRVLLLAGTHNHGTLLAAVAPYLVNLKPEVVEVVGFSTKLCTKWIEYRNKWFSTIIASKELLSAHDDQCAIWCDRIRPYLLTRIESPAGPIYRLVKGTNANGQKGLWEIYEDVMEKLKDETARDGHKEKLCCEFELQKWFHHVADELRGIQFPVNFLDDLTWPRYGPVRIVSNKDFDIVHALSCAYHGLMGSGIMGIMGMA
ncbi:hypothetical protein F5878DRAFT_645070 [Lentinula raphanica]|uniref:BTB domain-containing protein n=1 Tax=Lentinula raphanica TaxID=153919 RepID=A0AA38U970_9AGAR|nr:hypothetical protein F5878DRAFT_645070 [Lentinula raphanica]